MDREAVARAQRRAEAEEALESERDRETGLNEAIALVAADLEGAKIDAAAFAKMAPQDAELVRSILRVDDAFPEDEPVDESWEIDGEFEDEAEDETGPADEAEAELARLQAEIADSRRRQQALEAYLGALEGEPTVS